MDVWWVVLVTMGEPVMGVPPGGSDDVPIARCFCASRRLRRRAPFNGSNSCCIGCRSGRARWGLGSVDRNVSRASEPP